MCICITLYSLHPSILYSLQYSITMIISVVSWLNWRRLTMSRWILWLPNFPGSTLYLRSPDSSHNSEQKRSDITLKWGWYCRTLLKGLISYILKHPWNESTSIIIQDTFVGTQFIIKNPWNENTSIYNNIQNTFVRSNESSLPEMRALLISSTLFSGTYRYRPPETRTPPYLAPPSINIFSTGPPNVSK